MPSSSKTKAPLDPTTIRIAVGHLIELAALHSLPNGRRDDDATRTLVRVTELILAHRSRAQATARRVATADFVTAIAAIYRWFSSDPKLDEKAQRARISRVLLRHHVQIGRALALEILVRTRAQIRASRGAVLCAAERVAEVLDKDERTMFNRRKEARDAGAWVVVRPRGSNAPVRLRRVVPIAFGKIVTEKALAAYALSAIRAKPSPPPGKPVPKRG